MQKRGIYEKQSKGVPTNRDIRWDRLDNTAHLFPVIAGESMSNVYRISVTLKEEINPELLQRHLIWCFRSLTGLT